MHEYDKKVAEDMASRASAGTTGYVGNTAITMKPHTLLQTIDDSISSCIQQLNNFQEQKRMLLEDPSLEDKLRKFNGIYIY